MPSPWAKFAIGLAAALGAGAIAHGPLGRGEAFLAQLEGEGRAVIERSEIPGIEVRMQRDPMARTAILSGPADSFQREGQGSFPGLNQRVLAVDGVAAIEWTNPPPR